MSADNPLGLNGFEFVEFTSPDPDAMAAQFEQLGFVPSHKHPRKNITRYKQGRINLMLNRDETGRVAEFRKAHGPSAGAMAFRVADPAKALEWALAHGGKATEEDDTVIQGIGGSYLYFIKDGEDLYADWEEIPGWQQAEAENNVGLDLLDHLTHNVRRGQMRVLGEHYCDFTWLLPTARALREQIDWDRVREEVGDHPYGRAFLFLVDELGITGAGPRSTSSPGRADLPDDD